MNENYIDPFEKCPVLKGNTFTLRLVTEEDAKDLLVCYGDDKSAPLFNSDNCNSNFVYKTEEEVLGVIKFWIREYNEGGYVRFSIVDNAIDSAVGTIEIFAKKEYFSDYGTVGLLRIDLASKYEQSSYISEVLDMVDEHFPTLFTIDSIITKAIPKAAERLIVISDKGYVKLSNRAITTYDDYYIKKW